MINKILCILFLCLNISLVPTYAAYSGVSSGSTPPESKIIENAIEATVFIATERNAFETSYFHECFRPYYEFLWPPLIAHGSGFIMNEKGYVATNAHVVYEFTDIFVILPGKDYKFYKASIVGIDPRSDVAILKIENPENDQFPYLTLGNSNDIKLGDAVFAIGNPIAYQLSATVTRGIISGKERNHFGYPIEGFIQTDAALNRGNSGGPLINSEGKVIGMMTFGLPHCISEGLGFAIPSNTIQSIANQLINHGEITHGVLGVELEPFLESAFDSYYFAHSDGARVKKVIKHSPAEISGFKKGDIILQVNDIPIASPQHLKNQLWILEPGIPITFVVDRDGELIKLHAKLEDIASSLVFYYVTPHSLWL